MTVSVFHNTAVGAPALNGTVGSFIAILDFCLLPIGWTKEFSDTNVAVYKQPAGSNGFYLRVDDSMGANVRVIGYESMTSLSTGTFAFPTEAQQIGGLYFFKSGESSASTSIPWMLVTNGKMFHFLSQQFNPFNQNYGGAMTFGDFQSYKTSDIYNTILIASDAPGNSSNGLYVDSSASLSNVLRGHYVARSCTGIGGSIAVSKFVDPVINSNAAMGHGTLPYPCPVDNSIHLTPAWIIEMNNGRRGLLPGIWGWGHVTYLQNGDTFTGTGLLSGKTFEAFRVNGQCLILETSSTW